MKTLPAIDRYIFRLVLMPMIAVFLIAASLLVLDKMLRLFEFVGSEGGPVSVVFRMLATLLPEYASLAIPLGLMLGILFAFRKLATTSELDVMRAVGLGYTRLLRVPFMLTIVLAAVNFAIVGYVQPLSRYYYEQMQFELRSGALGASIKVGEFTTLKDKMALRIERSEEDGRRLIGIFARFNSPRGQVLTISAREGRFLALEDSPNTIILRLTQGQIIQDQPGKTPRVLSFTRHDLPIELPAIEKFRQRGGKEREYVLPELLRIGWIDQASEKARNQVRASFNYRMVEVVMMLLLPLLAVALAVPPKRSTSPLGVFVSIVMVVAYHKINEYGQAVSALGKVSPVLALWGPFVVFAILIVWMYWRVAYVPGGQAIGALERFVAVLGKRAKALFARRGAQGGGGLMLPDFFPSRTLTLYLARLFITRVLGVLFLLVLILQMLDLLSESGKILAYPGNGEAELWHYVSLRTPQLIARFLPYSVLLATLFTFWPLNQHSEVIAMRAAGLSAHQILAPLLVTAALVSLVSFAFNERVVTRASATLKSWEAAQWGPVPKDSGIRSNVYFRDGRHILAAMTVSGSGAETRMKDVTWSRRDAQGVVLAQVRAPLATWANPGWKLENPRIFDVAATRQQVLAPLIVAPGVTPAQVAISKVDPDRQNLFELNRSIQALKASGRRTVELEAKWWHKISGPLSALLMPLLGSVAAFGLARSGQLLVRAVIGMALGFAYFVVDNAALAMGNFGGYPPLIAAWAPFFLFALVGETVLVRTEE